MKEKLNKLFNQDCIELMKSMPNDSVDLIVADPPYYKIFGDFDFIFKDEKEYIEWTKLWVAECFRILKPTGAFYCWGSDKMIDKISVLVLNEFDWEKRNLIVWNFKTGVPSKKAFRIESEYLWFYSKKEHKININDIRIPFTNGVDHTKDKRKNPNGKSCGNVWEFSRVKKNYKDWTPHPTQKPLDLCKRIIKSSSNINDIVFIPFAGSGSEIVACIELERKFIATELNTKYCEDIIVPRMSKISNVVKDKKIFL